MEKKKKTAKSKEKKGAPSFEEALEQLESMVHDLEEGQVGLEESLAKYESGVKLLRHCYRMLSRAEQRIELLSQVDDQGNPVTEPFGEGEEEDETLSEKAASRSRRRTAKTASGTTSEAPSSGGSNSKEESEGSIDDTPLLF